MTDIKKEQEREELHRAIWAIADELRGAVDGWDFKNYQFRGKLLNNLFATFDVNTVFSSALNFAT